MNEKNKAETEAAWNALKPALEPLIDKVTAYYTALGTNRHCRHINELWHPENAGVGLGFVPPEALPRLEALIVQTGLHLNKGNGPLGKAVYFSLLYDSQFTAERLGLLSQLVEKETLSVQKAPPAPKSAALPTLEAVAEEQLARVEGLTAARGEKLLHQPHEVVKIVEAFNGSTMDMNPVQVAEFLEKAIPFFNLTDITRHELLRTVSMIRDAEKNAKI